MTKKRLFDLVLSTCLLPVTAVAGLVGLAVVAIDTRTWPLYSQKRTGQNCDVFKIYKIRTMDPRTPDLPSHDVTTTAVTRSGRLLRRLKLDEVPQLWNVIRGDMSLVGPRPCLPTQDEVIEERQKLGLDVLKPGITGPGQLSGLDMSTPRQLAQADAEYLRPWSARTDLSILWKTVAGGGRGDAVKSATSPYQTAPNLPIPSLGNRGTSPNSSPHLTVD